MSPRSDATELVHPRNAPWILFKPEHPAAMLRP